MSDMKKLGGLWANRSGNGHSGAVKMDQYTEPALDIIRDGVKSGQGFRVLLFDNKSDNPNSPEFDVLVAPVDDGQSRPKQAAPADDWDDGSIPF